MQHVVLLGDSIFANAAYVGGGPDVVAQVRQKIPSGWRATLEAVDGATIANIGEQLEGMPHDATHIVVSVGGNDALGHSVVLAEPSRSVADSLEQLSAVQELFRRGYRTMLDTVLRRGLPTTVCTIYEPRYPGDPERTRVRAAALCIINDCIIREAAASGVPIIDLRFVCSEDVDFANAIEPSVRGGNNIAAAIVSAVTQFAGSRSEIFTR
jgi:hypothetical protein